MIGTIRKHSGILWWSIATLTIISFVFFMGKGSSGNGGGSGSGGDFGSLYGQPITAEQMEAAKREFLLAYWFHNQAWPDKDPSITSAVLAQQEYEHLILARKAAALGIYVSEDSVASAAAQTLRMLGRGQAVPMSDFSERVLQPEGLTVDDFANYIRTQLTVEQLAKTIGMSGAFVTPQSADTLYNRENQEVSAQAVFFSASNYLARATVSPAVVGQFFTNNMAYYREPDRVQVSYVAFNITNYLAQAKAEWAKTNFEDTVTAYFNHLSAAELAEEKTPEAAKAKIREELIRQRAGIDAGEQAKAFVTTLFAMTPVKPENLAVVAKQMNMGVGVTAPFGQKYGPEELLDAPEALTTAAFQLTSDSPFAGPIGGTGNIYVIALASQLPSSVPAFDSIRGQVTRDYQMQEAIALAREAGTNFWLKSTIAMATGKTFAGAAIASGEAPEALPAFSLSSASVPGFDDRAEIGQLKRAMFETRPGKISQFTPTSQGGFVMYVQSLLPMDEAKKADDLPKFISQMRVAQENEAFQLWINGEINRELPNSQYFHDIFVNAQK